MKRLVLSEKDLDNLRAAEAEALKGSLYEFVKAFWSVIDTATFVDGWHIQLICQQLEAVYRGKPRRTAICIPPTCCKSRLASALFPVFLWVHEPDLRILCASFDQRLVNKFAADSLKLIRSEKFQALFPHVRVADKVPVSDYENTAGGRRISTTPKGRGTGIHADFRLVDDGCKASDARADRVALKELNDWFGQTWSSRSADPATVRDVVIGQRLHENDLPAHVMAKGFSSLVLPLEYESGRDPKDPRRIEGECLWPERFGPAEVAKMKADQAGSYGVASQLQQRPSPAEGDLFKKHWLEQRWTELPKNGIWCISVDCSFKDLNTSDWTVMQVWLASSGRFWLVDQVRRKIGFVETVQALKGLMARYPKAQAKLIESAANGIPVIDALRREGVPGIIPINPHGSKEARAAAVSALYEANNVWLPEAGWTDDYVHELLMFPHGRWDDAVDASSQALTYLAGKSRPMLEGTKEEVRDMTAALLGMYRGPGARPEAEPGGPGVPFGGPEAEPQVDPMAAALCGAWKPPGEPEQPSYTLWRRGGRR